MTRRCCVCKKVCNGDAWERRPPAGGIFWYCSMEHVRKHDKLRFEEARRG